MLRSCVVLYEGDLNFSSTEPVHAPAENMKVDGHDANMEMDGHDASEAQSIPSGTSTHGSGKKRKQSQVAACLDDYLEHKKKQSDKSLKVLLETKIREEEYSVEKCLDTVDAMELTDEDKAAAAEVLENDMNRQMFMKQKNLNARLIWLRRKLSRLATT